MHLCSGTKPDHSKTGGKKGLKIIQDPKYCRYGNTVDMDSALETFVPHRSDSQPQAVVVIIVWVLSWIHLCWFENQWTLPFLTAAECW